MKMHNDQNFIIKKNYFTSFSKIKSWYVNDQNFDPFKFIVSCVT